ncbi:hypothetical protein JTB14_005387 [Gonioctena quinquepunctata]|nr:hypothetical protein JTB14_005387 [Gonioctena quinquepunctata]
MLHGIAYKRKFNIASLHQRSSSDNIRFELITKFSNDDIEEKKRTLFSRQINDEIENEEDHDETDDPIVDDAEETSISIFQSVLKTMKTTPVRQQNEATEIELNI